MTNIKDKMTTKTIKTILFASLITAMILPFSTMDFADAQVDNKNPRDKTLERLQEKNDRAVILKKIIALNAEKDDLKIQINSEKDQNEKQKINKRLNEIKSELDKIEKANHEKDIPQLELEKLIGQQTSFEDKLLNSNVFEFVTSVGIDITSKEIQVGLDQDTVNSENIDSIIDDIEQLMPSNAKWHTVYSDRSSLLSCTQTECDPLIGGNFIEIVGSMDCSFGFMATKNNVDGFITAGHCADDNEGADVKNDSGDVIGEVDEENFYWGTSCDCAWITGDDLDFNNEVYDAPSTHTVTTTTQASEQQNDTIYKTGQAGGQDFGTVSAINVTVYEPFTNPPQYIKHLVRSDTDMAHGDSGGPVVDSNDRGDLYGIATTHDSWGYYHTPVDQITAHMGVSVVLN